mgnify:CR=1 FL=1
MRSGAKRRSREYKFTSGRKAHDDGGVLVVYVAAERIGLLGVRRVGSTGKPCMHARAMRRWTDGRWMDGASWLARNGIGWILYPATSIATAPARRASVFRLSWGERTADVKGDEAGSGRHPLPGLGSEPA